MSDPRTASEEHMNVMLVTTPVHGPLGADTWVHLQILGSLDSSTHTVHVGYVNEYEGKPTATAKWIDDTNSAGLKLVRLHPGPDRPTAAHPRALVQIARSLVPTLSSVVSLARYLRTHKIQVLHTTDRPRDALLCVLLGKLTGVRSIVHVHVLYNDWMGRSLRWAIKNADARIAVSEFVKQSLTAAGLPDESTHVVLNAVDVSALEPGRGRTAIRDEFGLEEAQPVVATVCRLFAEKGPEELIRAIDMVRQGLPTVQLLIVGRDPTAGQTYRAHLDQVIDELDLRDHVRFTGRRSDVPAIMAAADVFAMPSFEEPFGLVFGEAMAMERPVVALDNGGTREVVDHGLHGLLSEHGDIAALAQNLKGLLADEELRRRMGKAGRARVLADFTIDRMAADVAAVYRVVGS